MTLPPRFASAIAAAAALSLLAVACHPRPPEPARPPSAHEGVPFSSRVAFNVWRALVPGREAEVRAFQRHLAANGVAGVLPLHQVMRTESDWVRCMGQPFAVAPRALWPHIVGTLRFIRDRVVPAIGAVDVMSGYRSPAQNACSGGASQSAHLGFWALDLVPVGAVDRDTLIARLCALHAARGEAANIGLGFYDGRRFHIDSLRFRRWGADRSGASSPCDGAR